MKIVDLLQYTLYYMELGTMLDKELYKDKRQELIRVWDKCPQTILQSEISILGGGQNNDYMGKGAKATRRKGLHKLLLSAE